MKMNFVANYSSAINILIYWTELFANLLQLIYIYTWAAKYNIPNGNYFRRNLNIK